MKKILSFLAIVFIVIILSFKIDNTNPLIGQWGIIRKSGYYYYHLIGHVIDTTYTNGHPYILKFNSNDTVDELREYLDINTRIKYMNVVRSYKVIDYDKLV